MNNAMILAALLLISQGASSLMLDSMPASAGMEQQSNAMPSIKAADGNEMTDEVGVQVFEDAMKHSSLYALLLALDSEVPLVAKNAKYVVMVNEMHQTHTSLTQLLAATEKNNQLLEQLLIKQGNPHG